MIANIIIVVMIVVAVVSAGVAYFALTRLKSDKRDFFVLFAVSIFIYQLGYIFEVYAQTTEGGFLATRLMYLGSAFVSPLFLIFVQRYCEIRLPRVVNALIMLVAAAILTLVWTSDRHTLYYASMWIKDTDLVSYLAVTPGPLYVMGMIHPVLCVVTSIVICISKLCTSGPEMRVRLLIFIVCAGVPIFSHVLYVFNLNIEGVTYVPFFLALTTTGLYLSTVKYDLFGNEEVVRSQIWFKEMVANITHDLRTPLAVMSVNLEELTEIAAARGDAEYKRLVQTAYRRNLDLQRLIQNLLEASRIESSRNFYNVTGESLHRLFVQVRDRYGSYLEDKGIELDITLGDDVQVGVDPAKLWSVFDNIIYNAVRHTESGGSITVSARVEGTEAEVTISDTGCGISTEHLPKIFERFYKCSRARGTSEGDTGMGLYIVKSIMEGCGGRVRAESVTGKGTSIILTFLVQKITKI